MISSQNPSANGQVERFYQTIEANLCKFSIECPGGKWWEFLQDIARGLRLLPVRASGYAPYVLVFKQLPQLPIKGCLKGLSDAELEEWVPAQVEEQVGIWAEIFDEVRKCEGQYDNNMIKGYLQCKGIAKVDVYFCFAEGDQVLCLARRDLELSPCTWGPYIFVRYSPSCTTKDICDAATGKVLNISVAHLRPMHPERAQLMHQFPPVAAPPREPPSHSSEDPTIEASSNEDLPMV